MRDRPHHSSHPLDDPTDVQKQIIRGSQESTTKHAQKDARGSQLPQLFRSSFRRKRCGQRSVSRPSKEIFDDVTRAETNPLACLEMLFFGLQVLRPEGGIAELHLALDRGDGTAKNCRVNFLNFLIDDVTRADTDSLVCAEILFFALVYFLSGEYPLRCQ